MASGDYVSVIDTSTNQVIAKVKTVGSSEGITVSPDGKKVYVTTDYDTNVSFGSINITGLKPGTTNLNIIPTEVTDLNGNSINPDVDTCKVTVITIPPFPGCKYPPQDLDNDGLYEDINGNGRLESADVVTFFKNTQWVIDNGLIQYFDFNRDGRINSADVIKLFKIIH